jgi:dihydrolipoamide dehydrogenase
MGGASASKSHDLVVIGAGPGGYIAAIRAAQLGMDVACVEKERELGGTCLRIGCIPSKAMLESSELFHEARSAFGAHGVRIEKVDLDLATMLKRKDGVVKANTSGVEYLFKKNKVTRYLGTARLAGAKVVVEGGKGRRPSARHVLIATGSVSAPLKGVEIDGDRIGTSTERSPWAEVQASRRDRPGAIGARDGIGVVASRIKVTVLEYLDRILPGWTRRSPAKRRRCSRSRGSSSSSARA